MKERISRDFTWEEMTYSRVAVENGLVNEPPFEVKQVMMELVKRLLQPLRLAYGKPIAITSGYRSPEVNRLVGGVPSSQHVKGRLRIVMCLIRRSYWMCYFIVSCLSIRRFFINERSSCICRFG